VTQLVVTTIHLIDASPYIFRAFFALPKTIRAPDGTIVNAVYGFASFVVKYLTDWRPTHIAIAFDQNLTGSFRNEMLAGYKAARREPPAELESQVSACVEMAQALGVATHIDPDYEADDLIATLIHRLGRSGREFLIASVDKDLAQLVGPRVKLHDPGRFAPLDAQGVQTKYGVRPEQITDWLALAGDPVDSIPGVRGIGPKTAATLLERYGSLEAIYARIGELRGSRERGARSIAARLEANVALAGLSKQMATLVRDVPLRTSLAALRYSGIREPELEGLLARLGFRTLAARLMRR